MPAHRSASPLTDGVVTLQPATPDGAAGGDGGRHHLAVEHEGVCVGSVSLTPDGEGGAMLAFGLAAQARGRGLASRAVRLLLDWALTEGRYAVVHWRGVVGDFASRRVVWATGFTFSGTVPRLHRGELTDTWTAWTTAGDVRSPQQPWLEPMVLETARLRLRPWRPEDGVALVEASHDERLRHFIPDTPLPRDPDAVPAYLLRVAAATASGDRVAWCVADRESDEALGNVAVFDFYGPPGAESAQVGYWAHPRARGRGVMGEAVRQVADWGLAPEGLGLRRLYLLTAVSNAASRHVAEQAGFEHVGIERGSSHVGDRFEDSALYDRLRRE